MAEGMAKGDRRKSEHGRPCARRGQAIELAWSYNCYSTLLWKELWRNRCCLTAGDVPESLGGFLIPVSHNGMTNREPVSRLPADWSHGNGSELRRT